jgi:hypothetical protein
MRKEQPFPDGDEPQAVGPNGAYATAGSSDYLIGFERAGHMRIGFHLECRVADPKALFQPCAGPCHANDSASRLAG